MTMPKHFAGAFNDQHVTVCSQTSGKLPYTYKIWLGWYRCTNAWLSDSLPLSTRIRTAYNAGETDVYRSIKRKGELDSYTGNSGSCDNQAFR